MCNHPSPWKMSIEIHSCFFALLFASAGGTGGKDTPTAVHPHHTRGASLLLSSRACRWWPRSNTNLHGEKKDCIVYILWATPCPCLQESLDCPSDAHACLGCLDYLLAPGDHALCAGRSGRACSHRYTSQASLLRHRLICAIETDARPPDWLP